MASCSHLFHRVGGRRGYGIQHGSGNHRSAGHWALGKRAVSQNHIDTIKRNAGLFVDNLGKDRVCAGADVLRAPSDGDTPIGMEFDRSLCTEVAALPNLRRRRPSQGFCRRAAWIRCQACGAPIRIFSHQLQDIRGNAATKTASFCLHPLSASFRMRS